MCLYYSGSVDLLVALVSLICVECERVFVRSWFVAVYCTWLELHVFLPWYSDQRIIRCRYFQIGSLLTPNSLLAIIEWRAFLSYHRHILMMIPRLRSLDLCAWLFACAPFEHEVKRPHLQRTSGITGERTSIDQYGKYGICTWLYNKYRFAMDENVC